MSKLPPEYDHPLDRVLFDGIERMCPFLKRTHHTPNVITTYSFAFGLCALYALWTAHVGWFVLAFGLSYFFDCVDGLYARKYHMTSQFGDYYDHVTDIVVHVGIILIVVHQRKQDITYWHAVVLVLGLLLLNLSLACQQRRKSGGQFETLDLVAFTCVDDGWIRWTRFFGPTTFNLVLIALILHLYLAKRT